MKENNKGITLLVLTITVILMIIIASTATYYSISAYNNAKLTKFETELKIMQTQVELLEEEGKVDIGESLDGKSVSNDNIINTNNTLSQNKDKYRYLSASDIRTLGIDGIEQDYLVVIDLPEISDSFTQENLDTILKYRVIAVNGLKYRGNTYYTLAQLQDAGLAASTYSVLPKDAVASLTNKATGQVTIFSSVQDAVDAAGENPSIVTLLKDVELIENEDTIKKEGRVETKNTQNIILNTNGKTLSSLSDHTIVNKGSLQIEGEGEIKNSEYYPLYNVASGIVNINQIKIDGGINGSYNQGIINLNGGEIVANGYAILSDDTGSINIKSGKVKSLSNQSIRFSSKSEGMIEITGGEIIGAVAGIYCGNKLDLKMTGGTIIAQRDSQTRGIETVKGKLEISGGTIVVNSKSGSAFGITANNQSSEVAQTTNVIISGGEIIVDSVSNVSYGIVLTGEKQNESTINISGDSIVKATSDTSSAIGIYNRVSTGDITISGGTIIGNDRGIYNTAASNIKITSGLIESLSNIGIYNTAAGQLEISGGEVKAKTYGLYFAAGDIEILGGTINVERDVDNNGYAWGIANEGTGNITISGGSINVKGYGARGIEVRGVIVGETEVNIPTLEVSSNGVITAIGTNSSYVCYGILVYNNSAPNNESENVRNATINITGGKIIASGVGMTNAVGISGETGSKSISNLNISGSAVLQASSENNTANGICNYYSTGNITISGGVISGYSTNGLGNGLYTAIGALKIWDGEDDSNTNINIALPTITGSKYGVNTANGIDFKWYDGKIIGGTSSIVGTRPILPDNCEITTTTENSIQTSIITLSE